METQQILRRTLSVMVVIASVIWTITCQAKVSNCCTQVTMNEVTDPIISYKLQKHNLPCVKAIILETQTGRFCINPKASWVREKVRQLRAQQKSKHLETLDTSTPSSSITKCLTSNTPQGITSNTAELQKGNTCCTTGLMDEVTDLINKKAGFKEKEQGSTVKMDTQRLSMGNLAVMMAIASVIWTTAFAYAPIKAPKCCQKVSRSEVTYPIISYRLQIKNLPCVKAVLLETQGGKFCIHPRASWVREKILQFKRAQKQKLAPITVVQHVTSTPPSIVKTKNCLAVYDYIVIFFKCLYFLIIYVD
ncbi:uncharacterized protein [Paramisgurnus dabryanus]|uniref:uncharacterized protein n=1 Tax=Paramisgurnus dabryanus TaxID=90735 RepID=UPI0031F3A142